MGKLSKLKGVVDQALDMSREARMQRAREMGFDTDTVYYHGTVEDFDSFDKTKINSNEPRGDYLGEAFYFSAANNPYRAERYATAPNRGGSPNIIPAYLKFENPLIIPEGGGTFRHLLDEKGLSDVDWYSKTPSEQAEQIRSWGYDSLVDKDYGQTAVFDPSNIRSVNAAFDPAKKDSSNLLASVGGAAVLGGAALAPEDAEAGVFGKIIKAGVNTSKKAADEYSAGHTAPYRDADGYHPQLDNVEPMYGEDIYGRQAKNLYGYEDGSNESIDIIQRMRGKPDAEVDIYRAVPAGVNEFNQRDWVTLSKRYAREHGDSNIEGRYDILKGKAKASDLFNEGYPAEWGIDVLDVAKKYGISTVLAGSVLAGTMTPEQAQAATGLENFTQRRAAKRDYWKQLKSTMLEGMAGVNRGLIDTLNFVGPDQVNAVLQLSGSEKSIPTFSDIPGVQQATEGGYMEPGTARDIVRTGSEFLSPL